MKPQLPEGHTVKYQHHRVLDPETERPLPRGGMTIARIFNSDGVRVAEAAALCHINDNYSRRLGRDISLGRALFQLNKGRRKRGA